MKLLLDTHAFLWFIQGSGTLSPRALEAIEDDKNELWFSAASYWEICIKTSIGRLELAKGWPRIFDREMRRNGIQWLDLRREHLLGIVDLPFHHRDPFDRLLIAQAVRERLVMVSADGQFSVYGVRTLW